MFCFVWNIACNLTSETAEFGICTSGSQSRESMGATWRRKPQLWAQEWGRQGAVSLLVTSYPFCYSWAWVMPFVTIEDLQEMAPIFLEGFLYDKSQ